MFVSRLWRLLIQKEDAFAHLYIVIKLLTCPNWSPWMWLHVELNRSCFFVLWRGWLQNIEPNEMQDNRSVRDLGDTSHIHERIRKSTTMIKLQIFLNDVGQFSSMYNMLSKSRILVVRGTWDFKKLSLDWPISPHPIKIKGGYRNIINQYLG